MKFYITASSKEKTYSFFGLHFFSLKLESIHVVAENGAEFEQGPDAENPIYRKPINSCKLGEELRKWMLMVSPRREKIELVTFFSDFVELSSMWQGKCKRPDEIPVVYTDLWQLEKFILSTITDEDFENSTDYTYVIVKRNNEIPFTEAERTRMFSSHINYPRVEENFPIQYARYMRKLDRFLGQRINAIINKNISDETNSSQE
jgi:hypothetical protein